MWVLMFKMSRMATNRHLGSRVAVEDVARPLIAGGRLDVKDVVQPIYDEINETYGLDEKP